MNFLLIFLFVHLTFVNAWTLNSKINEHMVKRENKDYSEFQKDFTYWQHKFKNGNYEYSLNEKQDRLVIFANNVEEIKRLNNKYGPATFALNEFADIKWDDFKKRLRSVTPDRAPESWVGDIKERNVTKLSDANGLPQRFSWKNEERNIITPVKTQGSCGGGWAFATIAVAESMAKKVGKGAYSFSEQQILDSVDEGCDGGDVRNAFGYFQDAGVASADSYPYKGVTGTYQEGKTLTKLGTMKDLARDEFRMAYSLKEGGPFAVTFKVGPSFQFYKSGILSADDCDKESVWHSVAVTGFGNGYWEIKNSFGTTWGEEGFAKVKRNSNWCQIEDGPTTGWFF